MNSAFTEINTIPVRTWRWLKVNDATLQGKVPTIGKYINNPFVQSKEGTPDLAELVQQTLFLDTKNNFNARVHHHLDTARPAPIEPKILEFSAANRNSSYHIQIPANTAFAEPILLSYELDDANHALVDEIDIRAEGGSEATVIIVYRSKANQSVFHSGITSLHLEKDAKLHLVKIQMLGDADIHTDHVIGTADENAALQITLAELGAAETIGSCHVDLGGTGSTASLDSIYLGDQARSIDLNYKMMHRAKDSISHINAQGVLMAQAKKTFRGTIDFISGCVGAKGGEEEHTILLSPKVKNISVPLLLCGEADVEGAHAASIGKLSESMLFYLRTRGLSEKEARRMMVSASFAPIIESIPNAALQQDIHAYVEGRLDNE